MDAASWKAKGRSSEGAKRSRTVFASDPEVNGYPCTPLSNAVGFFNLSRRTGGFILLLPCPPPSLGTVCDRTNLFARVFDSAPLSFLLVPFLRSCGPRGRTQSFLPASFGQACAPRRMRAVLKRSANGVNGRISRDQIGLSAPRRNAPRLLRFSSYSSWTEIHVRNHPSMSASILRNRPTK